MATLTVPTIFTALDKFTGPLSKMQGKLLAFASTGDAAGARLSRSLKNVGDNAKSIAQSTAIAGLAIAAPLIYAAKEAANFENNMAKINTLVGANSKTMALMGKQVLNITRKIPVSIEDVTAGLYIINSAGITGAKGMDMLTNSSKLAVAGLGTVQQSSNMMTSVFNVFNKEGLNSAQIFDKLALVVKLGKTRIDQMSSGFGKAAITTQLAGVQLNEFLSMVAALTVTGSTASEAYTQITGAAQALLKPQAAMLQAFHALGVTGSFAGQKLIDKYHGLVPAMAAVNKVLDNMGIRRAKAWGRISAFTAQAALTPGGKSNDHYKENMNQMQTQPGAGESMYQTMLGTTNNQFILLKNNLRAFTIEVGTHLLPALTTLARKITPIIDAVMNWMDKNPGLVQGIIDFTAGLAGFLLVISPLATIVWGVTTAIRAWKIAVAAYNFIGGLMTIVTGAASDAFWALAAAMYANPIGLIIAAVIALIAVVVVIIKYWHEWGAAISLFLGPLGMVISFFKELYDNWSMIQKAFKDGGIIGALKAIGAVFVSALLHPLEQMLSIIGRITGWQWAKNAAADIYQTRAALGVNMDDSNADAGPKIISPPMLTAQINAQRIQQSQTLNTLGISIYDPGKSVVSTSQSGPLKIPVKLSTTQGVK